MADKQKITLYDILMLCGQEELVDIVYNGYPVVVCKPAGDLCDLLQVLDDEILNSLVFKLEDLYGKFRIHCTEDLRKKIEDYE